MPKNHDSEREPRRERGRVLGSILSAKQVSVSKLRGAKLPSPPAARPIPLNRGDGPLALLTEFKRRSPSAGELSTALTLEERVAVYERCGSSMISVLCDEPFFGGSFEDLATARQNCSLPIFCKDFIVDEIQLDAARAYGADGALLIVRCLEAPRVSDLLDAATARGLAAMVEVTTEEECQIALDAGATWVGVNARDLDTLEMDVARAGRVIASLPDGVVRTHLSGLKDAAAVNAVAQQPIDAALVGEALMRLDDPSPLLKSMVRAGASAGHI
jgi:indole-3-glycerol phosphate synthase